MSSLLDLKMRVGDRVVSTIGIAPKNRFQHCETMVFFAGEPDDHESVELGAPDDRFDRCEYGEDVDYARAGHKAMVANVKAALRCDLKEE